MASVVTIQEATKNYRLGNVVVRALRGIDLDIADGEFLSVAGPSGSGKTTLLNLIGCVDTPTSGRVLVAGEDIAKLSDSRLTQLRLHAIGFIFQSFNLVNVLDVYRNVELPLLLQGTLSNKQRKARVSELLERVGLGELQKNRPNELSGGQRQRVAIARALVTRPRIVLADEPTANLDTVTGDSILELMKELNQSAKTTFIFSTHDPRVMAQASRVVEMVDGLLVTPPQSAGRAAAVGAA